MLGLVGLCDLLHRLLPEWNKLSDSLRVPFTKKSEIDNQLSVETCLMDMLEKWITNSPEESVTFEALIRGLESYSVGNRALAFNISEDVEVFNLLRVSTDYLGTVPFKHPSIL